MKYVFIITIFLTIIGHKLIKNTSFSNLHIQPMQAKGVSIVKKDILFAAIALENYGHLPMVDSASYLEALNNYIQPRLLVRVNKKVKQVQIIDFDASGDFFRYVWKIQDVEKEKIRQVEINNTTFLELDSSFTNYMITQDWHIKKMNALNLGQENLKISFR